MFIVFASPNPPSACEIIGWRIAAFVFREVRGFVFSEVVGYAAREGMFGEFCS